ncbi:MAG: pilin [bacterium]
MRGKNIKKIISISGIILFIFFIAELKTFPAQAQEQADIRFRPQVTIDDTFKACQQGDADCGVVIGTPGTNKAGEKVLKITLLSQYIQSIYNYAIGAVGVLATVVLMYGGVLWIIAAGNAERVGEAKAWIGAALSGLVLALASYSILYIVNPKLTKNEAPTIAVVQANPTGCCEYRDKEKNAESSTKENCSGKGTFYEGKIPSEKKCLEPGETVCCMYQDNENGEKYCGGEVEERMCIPGGGTVKATVVSKHVGSSCVDKEGMKNWPYSNDPYMENVESQCFANEFSCCTVKYPDGFYCEDTYIWNCNESILLNSLNNINKNSASFEWRGGKAGGNNFGCVSRPEGEGIKYSCEIIKK